MEPFLETVAETLNVSPMDVTHAPLSVPSVARTTSIVPSARLTIFRSPGWLKVYRTYPINRRPAPNHCRYGWNVSLDVFTFTAVFSGALPTVFPNGTVGGRDEGLWRIPGVWHKHVQIVRLVVPPVTGYDMRINAEGWLPIHDVRRRDG